MYYDDRESQESVPGMGIIDPLSWAAIATVPLAIGAQIFGSVQQKAIAKKEAKVAIAQTKVEAAAIEAQKEAKAQNIKLIGAIAIGGMAVILAGVLIAKASRDRGGKK